MTLSCSSIAFASLPIEQAVAKIAELGFDALDLWSPFAKCPHFDQVRDRLGPNAFVALLEEHGIRPYAFSVYSGGFPRYAELIGEMGGGVVVRGSGHLHDRESVTIGVKRLLESIKPELELAERYNSQLAVENHSGRSVLNHLDSFKAFVDLNRHSRLGIALAPYHIQKNGESVEEAIRTAGDHLRFFYAWQYAKGEDQLPGIGPTDFRPWLAALREVGFRYPVNPFMHHQPEPDRMTELLSRSMAYLQQCSQA